MDCPSIPEITSQMQELSYEEKLKLIQDDAESLYEFCLKKGFSTKQMRTCVDPLLGVQQSFLTRVVKGSSNTLTVLSSIIVVFAVLIAWPPSQRMVIVHAKLLSLKTLYLYDWTSLYDTDCLIENTFLPPANITKDDCFGCIEFAKNGGLVDMLQNVDKSKVTDEYLYSDYPFVVTDAIRDWPLSDNVASVLTLDKIKELYLTRESLTSGLDECQTHSTLENQTLGINDFMNMVDNNELPNKFHFSWENCVPKAAKVFRLFTKRPYFLPAMAELSKANQLVVAKGVFEDSFMFPSQIDSASWFVVLAGSVKVELQPIAGCDEFKCKSAVFEMEAGDGAVVPTRVWEINYTPNSINTTIIFSSTVLWDDVA